MRPVVGFVVVVAVLVAVAVWLAGQPGSVTLRWRGYQVDTSFAFLCAAVAAVAVAAALAYRLWLALSRAPGRLTGAWRERRRRQGYQALTKGMVAVAAGDGAEARRQVKRASVLLNDPPLTMLLSAQAAQLAGDDRAAGQFFEAMHGHPEMEFLGVRGLLNQALNEGDTERALSLARRAYLLRPKSDWVAGVLFELQVKTGQWMDARVTTDEALRNKLIAPEGGRRRRAVLACHMSMESAAGGDTDTALGHARDAHALDPRFLPASLSLARRLLESGRRRRASAVIEETWGATPHPDLVGMYWQALGVEDALERVKAAERLAGRNPDHAESHLAIAGAALAAELWGEARQHLERATAADPTSRVCRMMAELEEAEAADAHAARTWLVRAATADPDSAWVCDSCGNAVTEWTAVCVNCGRFGSLSWRTPPRVRRLPVADRDADPPVALPPAVPAEEPVG